MGRGNWNLTEELDDVSKNPVQNKVKEAVMRSYVNAPLIRVLPWGVHVRHGGNLMTGRDEPVLVTGAAGFIGSHVSEKLLENGETVVGIDNLNDYYNPSLKESNVGILSESERFVWIHGDIRDSELMTRIFEKWNPRTVVHLAAMVGVRNSLENPNIYVEVNVGGSVTLLKQAAMHDVSNFVLASSSSVYGQRTQGPFKEVDSTDAPQSPYAATKKAVEVVAHAYQNLYDLQVSCLRFFTVYGPRGRPDMAPFKFMDRISRGLPIQQFGDGKSTRDYTFVSDIVQGIECAIKHPHAYEVFNLGSSRPVELSRFIRILEDTVKKKAVVEVVDEQAGDVRITYADISKARRMIGYRPSVKLNEGLERMYEWYLTLS